MFNLGARCDDQESVAYSFVQLLCVDKEKY